MPNEFLTPPEVARLLRCRESRILADIRSGRLRAINLSDGVRPRYRVSQQALDDYLLSRTVSPETRPERRQRRESQIPRYV